MTATREYGLRFGWFGFELACREHSKNQRGNTHAPSRTTTSPSSPAQAPASAARSRPAMPAKARASCCSTSTRRRQRKRRRKSAMPAARPRALALDVTRREDCVAMAKQIADKVGPVSILVNNAGIARRNGMLGAGRGRDQGLGGHHRDQPHRRLQRDACVPRRLARRPRGGSSTSARSSPSCMCARRVRRPTPPPSTACSASPRRSPPSSARTACASTRSARASSRRR